MAVKTYLSKAPQKSSMLVRHWHRLPGWWSLEVFKNRGDVVVRDVGSGLVWVDVVTYNVFANLNSMTQASDRLWIHAYPPSLIITRKSMRSWP